MERAARDGARAEAHSRSRSAASPPPWAVWCSLSLPPPDSTMDEKLLDCVVCRRRRAACMILLRLSAIASAAIASVYAPAAAVAPAPLRVPGSGCGSAPGPRLRLQGQRRLRLRLQLRPEPPQRLSGSRLLAAQRACGSSRARPSSRKSSLRKSSDVLQLSMTRFALPGKLGKPAPLVAGAAGVAALSAKAIPGPPS